MSRKPGGKPKLSEAEQLAAETLKMEAKLQVLKAEMAKQRMEADVPRTNSGSRWRAGAADIGSVTKYDKDVSDKILSRPLQPPPGGGKTSPRTNAVLRRPSGQRPGSSRKPLMPEEAASWSVDDVKRWLTTLGLEAYLPQFAENAITGEVLLEVGTEDLDYMKITVLGHRKLLLKGVEQLKAAVNPPPAAEVSMSLRPPKTVSGGTSTDTSADTAGGSLWVNPFQSAGPANPVDEVLAAISGVTLSDGPAKPQSLWDGEYDEDAERRAFQAAVAAWRGETKTTQPVTSSSDGASEPLPEPNGPGGALLQGTFDEEAEAKAFQAAVLSWRGGGGGEGTQAALPRVSCYSCFKLFTLDPASAYEASGKQFCGPSCLASHTAAEGDRARRAEEQRLKLAAAAAEASAAPAPGGGSVEDDVGGDVQGWSSAGGAGDPGYVPKDFSDIWSMNVDF